MPSPTHIQLLAAPWHVSESFALLSKARHWYRADTALTSGANLTALTNRGKAGGQLNVTAGTIAAPASDAALGGAPAIALTGTQHLGSSMPASEWTFLHNGTGAEIFVVMVPTALPPSLSVAHVLGTSSGSYMGAYIDISEYGSCRLYATKDSYYNVSCQASGMTAGAAFCVDGYYASSSMPAGMMRLNNATDVDAVETYPPLNIAASQTLRIGADARTGFNYLKGRIADIVIFDFVLTPYQRQVMREYVKMRYGIAAPAWSADEREILKLNPFSWVRADYYYSAAGKVSAFPDKVLPGHSFTQGTAANQVANPTADAALGSKLSADFVEASAHRYQSSLPASAWKAMHSGAGGSLIVCLVPTTTTFGAILHSKNGTVAAETGFGLYRNSTTWIAQLGNGTATILNATVGPKTNGAGVVIGWTFASVEAPDSRIYHGSTTPAFTGDASAAPSAADPQFAATIGARPGGVGSASFRFADLLFFNRALSATEIVKLFNYMKRYGL